MIISGLDVPRFQDRIMVGWEVCRLRLIIKRTLAHNIQAVHNILDIEDDLYI